MSPSEPTNNDFDKEILQEFVNESIENVELIERDILELEDSEHWNGTMSADLVDQLFRTMHSMKGAGNFFNLKEIVTLSHHCETLLSNIKNNSTSIEVETINVFLTAIDILKEMLSSESLGKDYDISDITENLERLSSGKTSQKPENRDTKPPVSPRGNEVGKTPAKRMVKKAQKSIRINVDVLDELLNLVGDVVTARNHLLEQYKHDVTFAELSQSITKLHKQVIQTRMQPVGTLFDKFKRIVRDLSQSLNKNIELQIEGSEIELDRTILELFSDPLTHLIRNAVDHGIDTPEERVSTGKPPMGNVRLRAYHESGQIMLEVEDDGRGIDPEILGQKALSKGLVSSEALALLDSKERINLIFHPGLSTKDTISQISGRGVGMDVVKNSLEKIGCDFEVSSQPGKGTRFTATMPFSQSIVQSSVISALIIRLGDHKLALSRMSVYEMHRLNLAEQREMIGKVNGMDVLFMRKQVIPIIRLKELLNADKSEKEPIQDPPIQQSDTLRLIILQYKYNNFAIIVDEIIGTEEIVVKKLPNLLKKRTVFEGTTILSSGEISVILNINGIVEKSRLDFEIASSQRSVEQQKIKSQPLQTQSLVIFRNGNNNYFAIPMHLISVVSRITPAELKQSGSKEYALINNELVSTVRLEDHIDISPVSEEARSQLIVLSTLNSEKGVMTNQIITSVDPEEGNIRESKEDGIIGTMLHNGFLVKIIDLYALLAPDTTRETQIEYIPGYETARLLVVEDTIFYRHLIHSYFASYGFRNITVTENGQKAIEALNAESDGFDIIISDVEMPLMNGYELASYLKSSDQWSQIPLIALTGLNNESDIKRCLASGFDAYEQKINKNRVINRVTTLLSKKKETQPCSMLPSA